MLYIYNMVHIWSQYQIQKTIFLKVENILNVILIFNKPTFEGHIYIIILNKHFDLVAIGILTKNDTQHV